MTEPTPPELPHRHRDPGKIPWALTFLLFQVFIAPVVAITALFGICAAMGFTH